MNLKITDIDGKKPTFTQWDVDRILCIAGCNTQPCLHFANALLERAIVVQAEEDGSQWKCRVPNFILQFAGPFVISVFTQPDEGKTVLSQLFPVIPKMKPQDYTYEENIGYVNWVEKSAQAEELLDNISALRAEIAEAVETAEAAKNQVLETAENIDDIGSIFSEKEEINYGSVEHGYFDGNTSTLKISQGSINRLVVYPVTYGSDYAIFRELKDESYYIVELTEEIHDGVSVIPVYNLAQNGWNGYYYTPSSANVRYIAVNCVYLSSTHSEENIIDALHVCRGLYDFNSYYISKRGPYRTVKQNYNIAALSTIESIGNLHSDAVFSTSESFALPFPIIGQPAPDNPHNIANINFIQNLKNSDVLSAIEEIGGYTSKTTIGYATGSVGDESMAIKLFTYRRAVANPTNSFGVHAKKILVTAGVHGNEKGAVYNLINFIRLLNSENPSAVNMILNNYDVDIIPCVNPWGFDTENRKNSNGVDLNRNYHYGWDAYTSSEKGSAPLSESESSAVAQVIVENQYDYIIDWHEASLTNGTYVATQNETLAKIFVRAVQSQFESMKLRYGLNPVQAQGQGVAEKNALPSLANEMLATSGVNNGTIFEQAWGGSATKWGSANICIGLECFVNYLLGLSRDNTGPGADLSAYRTAADQDVIDAAQDTVIAGKLSTTGDAYRAASIPMGQLDSGSTDTVMTATVPGITELRDGVCMWLENGVIASASGVTLNINALGAKPIYNSLAGTAVTTTFAKAATYLFVYNSTRVTGGCWDMVYGYDANTTYTPPKLGFGYGTCTTAAATAAKTASISSYALVAGGIVAIKFAEDVPAGATLNIASKGAKAIYYKGAAITAGVIKAGDTVTMIYSTYYHVLSIDRWGDDVQTKIGKDDGAVMVTMTASGNTVTCLNSFVGIYFLFSTQQKTYFVLANSQTDVQVFDVARVDAGNQTIYLSSIVGGVLSQIVLTPGGTNTMTGTLTTIDLNLANGDEVSY